MAIAAAQLDENERRDLIALRHELHADPELAGEEARTAERFRSAAERLEPDAVIRGLGGHGVAALFRGDDDAPPIILRVELDALPIDETIEIEHASRCEGVAHKCGHDGHLVMAIGAAMLQRRLRAAGERASSIALLAQPAEETGAGARAVLEDGRMDMWSPRAVVGVHNVPGVSLGTVVVREGIMCRASVGMTIRLEGVRSHAATPEKGRSPIDALLRLASHVTSIGATTDAMVTIVSIRSGERDFGIAPGDAELCITIRGGVETPLDKLCTALEADARRIARAGGVSSSVVLSDAFPAVDNDRDAVRAIYAAAGALEREVIAPTLPFAFSEDVAHLIAAYGGAFCGIGAGEGHAALHDPTYDFPDALIEIGAPVLFEIARRMSDA